MQSTEIRHNLTGVVSPDPLILLADGRYPITAVPDGYEDIRTSEARNTSTTEEAADGSQKTRAWR
jgi:hypothetical protein